MICSPPPPPPPHPWLAKTKGDRLTRAGIRYAIKDHRSQQTQFSFDRVERHRGVNLISPYAHFLYFPFSHTGVTLWHTVRSYPSQVQGASRQRYAGEFTALCVRGCQPLPQIGRSFLTDGIESGVIQCPLWASYRSALYQYSSLVCPLLAGNGIHHRRLPFALTMP